MSSRPRTIHQSYGGFDGRFPSGILLEIQWPEQWDFLLSGLEDGLAIVKAHQADPTELFGIVSLGTTFDHERRHFHDSLLSPTSSAILTARLSVAMNAIQAMAHLADAGASHNALPLPLGKWVTMSAAERTAYLDSVNNFLGRSGGHARLSGPVLSPDDPVTRALAAADRAAARIRETLTSTVQGPGDFAFDMVDVAEASALVVQLQAIWTSTSESTASAFAAGLYENPTTRYGRLAAKLFTLKVPIATICAMTLWALLGAVDEAPPAFRFMAALADLTVRGDPNITNPFELFARWDTMVEATPVPDVLESSLRNDADTLEQRKRLAQASDARIAQELAQYYEAYVSARRTIVGQFLADPALFTNPRRYYAESSNAGLPEPFLVVAGAFGSSPHAIRAQGGIVLRSEFRDGAEQVRLVAIPTSDPRRLIHEIPEAQDMLLTFLISDAVVSGLTEGDALDMAGYIEKAVGGSMKVLRLPA